MKQALGGVIPKLIYLYLNFELTVNPCLPSTCQTSLVTRENLRLKVKQALGGDLDSNLLKSYDGAWDEGFRQEVCKRMNLPAHDPIRMVSRQSCPEP